MALKLFEMKLEDVVMVLGFFIIALISYAIVKNSDI